MDATVYLVPVGSGRFELYSEPPDEGVSSPGAQPPEFWRRQARRLHERWLQATHAARHTHESAGRPARARDWAVRRIAESIAEQRTLWSLRGAPSAAFIHPADLSSTSSAVIRERLLTHARRFHGRWLLIDTLAVTATAALMVLPGPNAIGYYFLFRVVGHFLSWSGARQGLERTSWRATPEPALTELGRLAPVPREDRADQVAALAERLRLPRLAVFFDRTAVPGR